MSLTNFLKTNILSLDNTINAKVSGALSVVDGAITAVDDIFKKLFGNLLSGAAPLSTLDLTYQEHSIVTKDQTITATVIDPQKVPITSNVSSPTFAESASNQSITRISPTQPNDISISPVGIEPPMAFRGQFPYVHSHKSESGHIKEVDDTPGHERLLDYHRSGTYEEIASDGRRVVKIVGDNYTIVAGTDSIHVEGSSNMYVRGNMSITCLNDVTINTGGSIELNVAEEFRLKASSIFLESSNGNIDIYSSNSINTRSKANTSLFSNSNINLLSNNSISTYASNNVVTAANNKITLASKEYISMDSPYVYTNKEKQVKVAASNTVAVARKTGLTGSITKDNTSAPHIFDVIVQGSDDDEESATAALKSAVDSGRITQKEVDDHKNSTNHPVTKTDNKKPTKITPPLITTAHVVKGLTGASISGELKISNNYKLCHLTTNVACNYKQDPNANYIKAQHGKSIELITSNLSLLAQNVLEPISKKFGPITINSGFRHIDPTKKKPGTISQHEIGQAVDITYGNRSLDPKTMHEIAQWIKANIAFDQLILEYGGNQIWTHVSFNGEGANRGWNDPMKIKFMTCPKAPTGPYVHNELQLLDWKPYKKK